MATSAWAASRGAWRATCAPSVPSRPASRAASPPLLLEALADNGGGRLWSIDLPPLLEHPPVRSGPRAGPPSDRWTLLRGSSRRMLGGLVAGLGRIELFVHDSMHTTRNVRFELERVWPALARGGLC